MYCTLLSLLACSIFVNSLAIVKDGEILSVELDLRSGKLTERSISKSGTFFGSIPNSCNIDQYNTILTAVTDELILANAAIASLKNTGSEKSAAYIRWFGSSNSNPQTRTAILNGNYQGVLANLFAPTTKLPAITHDMDPQSLTFACAEPEWDPCMKGSAAAASSNGELARFSGNLILACPIFFTGLIPQSTFLSNLQDNIPTPGSQGFSILHEVQHISDIVGASRFCVDKVAPSGNVAYSSKDCMALSDADKILNAQNLAYFAAYVAAIPASGTHTPNGSCIILKRETVIAVQSEFQESDEDQGSVDKRQVTKCVSYSLGPIPSAGATGYSDVGSIAPSDLSSLFSEATPTASA